MMIVINEKNDILDDWECKVIQELHELINLEKGWDGYEAGPVTLENAVHAKRLINYLMMSGCNVPHIVPGINGNIQLEWHENIFDRVYEEENAHSVEVEILGKNNVVVFTTWGGDPEPNKKCNYDDGDYRHLFDTLRDMYMWKYMGDC